MPDLDDMIEQLRRMKAPAAARPWYEVQAKAGDRKATIRIYDDIGWFGTSAKSFGDELAALDVDEIDLRLNSPGGDAWDGLAIHNALRAHPATVTVTVDGMAASAASLVAMGGDRVLMNRGAQMMVHDAWGMAIGNAADMLKTAEMLGKISDSYADVYAARAGGTREQWRGVMREETWYTAQEAVDAGLADDLADDTGSDAKARFDLSAYAFAYAGRDAAPPPKITRHTPPPPTEAPAKSGALSSPAPVSAADAARRIHAASTKKTPDANPAAGPSDNPEGAAEMQFTDEERTALRTRFNLSADAGDDAIKAALLAPPSTNPPDNTPPTAPAPAVTAVGTMTIDVAAWQEREERIKRLEAADTKRRRDERDQVIAQAVTDGKFPPARKEHWARLWDADPEGTRQVIDSLARNVMPVAALGYSTDNDSEFDDEFRRFFPPEPARKGA